MDIMLLALWTCVCLSVTFTVAGSMRVNCSGDFNLSFNPDSLQMREGMVQRIRLTMTTILNNSTDVLVTSSDRRIVDVVSKVTCTPASMTSACPAYRTAVPSRNDDDITYVSVYIKASRLGKCYLIYQINGHLNASLVPEVAALKQEVSNGDRDECTTEAIRYPVIVVRNTGVQDQIYHLVIQILLGLLNFAFGCELNMTVIWSYLKRPLAPSIGFCSQFLLMPLLGIAIIHILKMDPAFGMGLVSLSCAPGGGASNSWTILLGGDVNLSLTMTFLSLVLALGMMPLWMYIISHIYMPSSVIRIPYLRIITTLALFVGPCFLGIAMRKTKPQWAKGVALIIKPVSIAFLLWILTFGTYVNLYMFKMMGDETVIILAGILLPWCGFAFGFALAMLTRQGREKSIAISIETGIQNFGVPIVLLQRSFPQPEGDLGAAVVNSAGIFTPVPLFIVLILLTIKRRCHPDDKSQTEHLEPSDISNVLIPPCEVTTPEDSAKDKNSLQADVTSEVDYTLADSGTSRMLQSNV